MTYKFYKIRDILNAEGTIIGLYQDQDNNVYVQGLSSNGRSKIITKTNNFLLELYLHSRITLNYLLTHDSHVILIRNNRATEYIGFEPESAPLELKKIKCGDVLYDLLPKGMKSDLSVNEILMKLPEVNNGDIMTEIENIETKRSCVRFFSDSSSIHTIQIESEVHNPYEFDFLKVKLNTENTYLYCKVRPTLKMLLMNQISIQEYFKTQSDQEYLYYSGKEWYKITCAKAVMGMINNIHFGNLTYYSLPKEFQVESVMGVWHHYMKDVVLPGCYGARPMDFQTERPVDVELK
jgi:hypothetical protein